MGADLSRPTLRFAREHGVADRVTEDAAAELPGCAQELGELARCLDQLYFGGGAPAFSPARASELRRALRLASRPPERPARH